MVGKGDQGGGVATVAIDAPDNVIDVVPAPDGGEDGKSQAVEPALWYALDAERGALRWADALRPLRHDDGDLRQAARLVLRVLRHLDVLVSPGHAAGSVCRAVSACRAGDGDRAARLPLHRGFPDDEQGCSASGANRRRPDGIVWQGGVPVLVCGVLCSLDGYRLHHRRDAEG